ncbi:armadillo repeat-containing protein gudu [Neocloeon triangulifer]|uniref:armadillo repeat-containing protein gudu n=1 Tax=Neocloeon triangulifer TaxID=2078957 RepID=UPI00286ED6C7|nr:armadillo repeat-containing protein gudu [Neocloeon triangulifer]
MDCTYWDVQKLIKYTRAGNRTATILALSCLKDHELNSVSCQQAIRDIGGIEVLINLLTTSDVKCKIVALQVLSELAKCTLVRRNITDLGGVPQLVTLLASPSYHLRLLAAQTLAHVAKVSKASRMVRKSYYGLARLVDLLDIPSSVLERKIELLTDDEKQMLDVAHAGARALWSLSQSQKNKKAMQRAGCIPLLAKLLRSVHTNVLVPAAATVQQCATEEIFKLAMQKEGMIPDLVTHLSSNDAELRKHAALAIFKCAEEKATRDAVRQNGGLDPLVEMLKSETAMKDANNKAIVAALSGALWKCAISPENVRRLEELHTIDLLVSCLKCEDNEEVLTNLVGAIAECCRSPNNRIALRMAEGLPPLVSLLSGTNPKLLENTVLALGHAAQEPQSLKILLDLDGVRLVWTLLKCSDPKVQANAAASLCPFIKHSEDSAEMVRSLIGGFELLVSLLASNDIRVLSNVCATVSCIASKDRDNLGIITDYGVVEMLASLVITEDPGLRSHLSTAIAHCADYGSNCRKFGQLGIVPILVDYMTSNNLSVLRATANALYKLSTEPYNCICMFDSGVVPHLLMTIGYSDEHLQESSAGCLNNIRKMAIAAQQEY